MTENNPGDRYGEHVPPPSPWSSEGSDQFGYGPETQRPAGEPMLSGSAAPGEPAGQSQGQQGEAHQADRPQSTVEQGQYAPPGTPPPGTPPPGTLSSTGAPPPYGGSGYGYAYPEEAHRRGLGALVAGIAILALIIGGAAGSLGGYLVATSRASGYTSLDAPPPARQTDAPPAGSVESVAAKVLPSTVQLQVRGGEGSGFLISSDGLIATNNHVVASAANGGQIRAIFQDGTTAPATIVGRDPSSDLAVVKAQGVSGKTPVELGRSDDLRVGQAVVAIGSPFDLSGTVTSGIVSSLQRPTRAGGGDGDQTTVMDAIQTDAPINPGNSGGPLVNVQGQVIGINSAIYSPQQTPGAAGSVGIGFAIPIDQARRTIQEIVNTGRATQTVLGVQVQSTEGGGATIATITPGGPAEKAGLAVGDVVTKLDNRKIDSSDGLVAAVRAHAPGDKVTLTIDNKRTVAVTLAGQPVPMN